MAQLAFSDLTVEPWLGYSSESAISFLASKVLEPAFRERWKYTQAQKVFQIAKDSLDEAPVFEGIGQAAIRLSDDGSQRLKGLVAPESTQEKLLLICQSAAPLCLEILKSPANPLVITHGSGTVPLFIFVGENVACEIQELFKGKSAQRQALWLNLAKNAQVKHTRQTLEKDASHWQYLNLNQAEASRYQLASHNVGSHLRRQDFDIQLKGPDSSFELKSASFIESGQHLDQQISVKHCGQGTTSKQLINNVGDAKSKITCNGRILIEKHASKSEASLSNKNLALGDDVTINSKPELEIYNDDVKCSHGSTIGQLSESELFYLTSRSIDPKKARTMIARGFLKNIVDGPIGEKTMLVYDRLLSAR